MHLGCKYKVSISNDYWFMFICLSHRIERKNWKLTHTIQTWECSDFVLGRPCSIHQRCPQVWYRHFSGPVVSKHYTQSDENPLISIENVYWCCDLVNVCKVVLQWMHVRQIHAYLMQDARCKMPSSLVRTPSFWCYPYSCQTSSAPNWTLKPLLYLTNKRHETFHRDCCHDNTHETYSQSLLSELVAQKSQNSEVLGLQPSSLYRNKVKRLSHTAPVLVTTSRECTNIII